MKQCPRCNEHFGDEQNFCDSDGTPLIDETALLRAALQNSASGPLVMPVQSQASKVWPIVTIGILVGVIISLGAYVVIMTATSDKENAKSSRPESARLSSTDRSAQIATIKPGPLPTVEEPVVEPSPQETASPTPAEVAAAAPKEPSVSLNNGPISTNREDGEKRGRTLIKLKSGVSVEADAAWEDRLGIWYRQGGLVSYVERERIESIGEPARPKPAAAETEKP